LLNATISKVTSLPIGAFPSALVRPAPELIVMVGFGAESSSPPHEAKKPSAGIASKNNNFFIFV
jgi:hypothetical protein